MRLPLPRSCWATGTAASSLHAEITPSESSSRMQLPLSARCTSAKRGIFPAMRALQVRAGNSCSEIDEPTSLPDGAEARLVAMGGDGLDDE